MKRQTGSQDPESAATLAGMYITGGAIVLILIIVLLVLLLR